MERWGCKGGDVSRSEGVGIRVVMWECGEVGGVRG